jgi:hypothetical protein
VTAPARTTRATPSPASGASDRVGFYTTADAGRSLPSYGPEWDAAIEFGVDVTLILHNLELTPQQRLEQAAAHQQFIDEVQAHAVAPELREQLELERLWEKIDALGGPDPNWPESLRRRPESRER